MSGTDYTLTPNLGLYKPLPNADLNGWGAHLNTNADTLDTALHGGPFLALGGGTVTGLATFNAGLNAYVGNPAATGFTFNQNVFGTAGAGQAAWQAFNISADTADATAAQGHGATAAAFGHTISAGAVGGRTTMLNNLVQTGATTMTTSDYYVAHGAFATVNASTGGTAGVPVGALFGRNASARIATGAGLHQLGVCGDEINVSVQTGTAVLWKAGLNIVQWADDAVQGTQTDWAFGIVNQSGGTAPGWKTGINFGGATGWWAFHNTSTMIGTSPVAAGGPAVAANWGIDLSAVTFTGGFLRSAGFAVDGSGHVSPLLVNAANDAAAATAGVPVGAMYRNGNAVQVRLA